MIDLFQYFFQGKNCQGSFHGRKINNKVEQDWRSVCTMFVSFGGEFKFLRITQVNSKAVNI